MRQFTGQNQLDRNQFSDQLEALLTKAIELHHNCRLQEAEQTYRRILQAEPNHPEALHLLGVIALQKGHHQQALELILEAIAKKPGNPQFYNNLGLTYQALDQTSKARQSFQKALEIEPHYAEAYNNLGNAFKNNDRLAEAMRYFRKALQLAPEMPEAHLNLAKSLADKGRLEAAVRHYQQAIKFKPNYEKAYNNLGNVLKDFGQIDAAIENFRQAVCIKPDYVGALNNLANALRATDQLNEAILIYQQALEIAPDCAETYCNLANAFKDQGQFEAALDNYQQAIIRRTDFAEAHFNRSIVLLLKGNFLEGWKEYEWRLQRNAWQSAYANRSCLPRWDGETFVGKRLLVCDEQGFGDTLQFVRYLPLVKTLGGEIIFETRKELLGLFDTFPGIDGVFERGSAESPAKIADLYIPLLSLPGVFKTNLASLPNQCPYIFAQPDKIASWRSRLGADGLKVGIVWAGQSIHKEDRNRSCKIDQFAPLAQIPGVELIGLQKRPGSAQISALKVSNGLLTNFGEELKDFTDTAALIENLDLVICVDTAVAHLAGAMGKPVWVLLPFIPDWRWMLNRKDSPWYPTMRLFRQHTRGDWSEVFQRITADLRARVEIGEDQKNSGPAKSKAEDYFNLGNQHYDLNDVSSAITFYQKAIKANNDFFEAHFNLGKSYQDQQNFGLAIDCYKNALRINPRLYQACYNMGVVLHAQNKLDEAKSVYQQAIALKPDFAEAFNNLGVVLQELGKLGPAIACYQKALKLNATYAEAYYNKGRALHIQGRYDAAIESYQHAISMDPGYVQAHHNLGVSLHKQGKFDEAAACYQKTLQLKPDYLDAYYNMGNIFLDQGNPEEMTCWYQKALAFTPHKAEAYNNLGKMLQDQGKFSAAETYFQKAIQLDPDLAEAHFNRSMVLLLSGRYLEGWEEYEWRFKRSNWENVYPYRFDKPLWNGTAFAGQKLFVHCEQGFGDTLQFSRYLPMVKSRGGTVIFETTKPLVKIFHNFPGIDEFVEISAHQKTQTEFDLYVPLLSLPRIFRTRLETIPAQMPYIFADSYKKGIWQNRLDTHNLKVGIVWAGGSFHKKDSSRSCKLIQFLPLSRIAGVRLYGLQKGPASVQVEEFSKQINIDNFGPEFKDFSDTAALIENLDLIICVDTAIAHLAGAMAKPVWVLLPFVPDWRWMANRKDSPWYPTLRLFRQKQHDDWDDVFERVANELRGWVHQRTAAQKRIDENCK
jgi:tetratricopeptide (TPR) repeat protein